MHWSKALRPSLKALQVTMQYPNVKEYDGFFNANVPESKYDSVIDYCKNDVNSTEEFLNISKEDIDFRLSIERDYHISALNKDGVGIGVDLLKKKYLEKTKKSWDEIKDLRTPCDKVALKDIIFDYIEFHTPVLINLLDFLKTQELDPNDNSFEKKFVIGDIPHTFGMGGLHSESSAQKFNNNASKLLIDQDATSLYPNIISKNKLYPAHLGIEFNEVYTDIINDRISAKKSGDKLKADTFKLAINGASGNFQNEYSWLYDPKLVVTMRLNGQLMLLMHIENLIDIGAEIWNSNTDGVIFVLDKSKINDLEKITKDWENKTKLNLECEYFEQFYQYAVNDYIGIKEGWSQTHDSKLIKKKGLFIDTPVIGRGLSPLIIPEALSKYFIEGINPEETVYGCKDILKFCTFQKVDKKFKVFYGDKKVQNINRYFMSLYGQSIYKTKVDYDGRQYGTKIALCANSGVTIYNEVDDIPIEKKCINYRYYLNEIYKIIEKMNSTQLTLF